VRLFVFVCGSRLDEGSIRRLHVYCILLKRLSTQDWRCVYAVSVTIPWTDVRSAAGHDNRIGRGNDRKWLGIMNYHPSDNTLSFVFLHFCQLLTFHVPFRLLNNSFFLFLISAGAGGEGWHLERLTDADSDLLFFPVQYSDIPRESIHCITNFLCYKPSAVDYKTCHLPFSLQNTAPGHIHLCKKKKYM